MKKLACDKGGIRASEETKHSLIHDAGVNDCLFKGLSLNVEQNTPRMN